MTCQSKNVTYFLKCTSCNYSTTYIGNKVDLRSHMNNHIISCRLHKQFWQPLILLQAETETTTAFLNANVCQISRRYKNLFQNRGYDTLNKPKLNSPQFQLHFYCNQTVHNTRYVHLKLNVLLKLKHYYWWDIWDMCWNGYLLIYFSLIHHCGSTTNSLLLTFSRAEFINLI